MTTAPQAQDELREAVARTILAHTAPVRSVHDGAVIALTATKRIIAQAILAEHIAPILADLAAARETIARLRTERDSAREAHRYAAENGAAMLKLASKRRDERESWAALAGENAQAADTANASVATLQAKIAADAAEIERLRAALESLAACDAMDPPESKPLNEWLPMVTGARAALKAVTLTPGAPHAE